jgi:hypothetical protein
MIKPAAKKIKKEELTADQIKWDIQDQSFIKK